MVDESAPGRLRLSRESTGDRPGVGPGSGVTTVFAIDDHLGFLSAVELVVAATPHFELSGVASSGEGALRSDACWAADLVLVDYQLPGLNGLEVARRLATTGRTGANVHDLERTQQVVLMSSYDAASLPAHAATSAFVAGFVPKAQLSPAVLGRFGRHGFEQHDEVDNARRPHAGDDQS